MASPNLHALVDMGSNGIRFSITDLSPTCARNLPQIHHHRAPISLHDAQFTAGSAERRPLPPATIDSVVAAFQAFQRVCDAHAVPRAAVRVLATEATRTAPNADALLAAIADRVGWRDVRLLPKEEEARLGALGIAASVPACRGLVLDLGGGSVQLSWVRAHDDGRLPDVSDQVVSLPYGAAALMKRLEGADGSAARALEDEVRAEMRRVVDGLAVPDDLKGASGNVPVFLSGGGFRGWGYLLMANHPDGPYPIQMISGYSVAWDEFVDIGRVDHLVRKRSEAVAEADAKKDKKGKKEKAKSEDTGIHRISARRLTQLPAIKLVVASLASTLKDANISVGRVTFCAGGVPAGLLYTQLEPQSRAKNALSLAAAHSTAYPSTPALDEDHISRVFKAALPAPAAPESVRSVAPALAQLLSAHSPLPKDIRAAAALRFPVTGSIAISSALGVDHAQRAALGLALCARWGGEAELPDMDAREFARLRTVLGAAGSWWAELAGRLAALAADVAVHGGARVAAVEGAVAQDAQARETLTLTVRVDGGDAVVLRELAGEAEVPDVDDDADGDATADGLITGSGLRKAVKTLAKVGKKKRWVSVRGPGGQLQAYGMRVEVDVQPHIS